MKQDRVLITGASSGIGEALARALARPGTLLVLAGRDRDRLATSAAACRGLGAAVETALLDVRDRVAVRDLVERSRPLDLAFANAGLAYGTRPDGTEDEEQVRATFSTNLDGTLNTVLPALAAMRAQVPVDGVRGRIAVMASVAAFLPYPGTPSYCASKAAIDVWTVANAVSAARQGICLTSVCPGFIRTPMTDGNDFRMPGLIDVDDAVARILAGVRGGRRRVVFPARIGAGARLVSLLPHGAREALLNRQSFRRPAPMGADGRA